MRTAQWSAEAGSKVTLGTISAPRFHWCDDDPAPPLHAAMFRGTVVCCAIRLPLHDISCLQCCMPAPPSVDHAPPRPTAHAAAMPCGMQQAASSSMQHATAPMLRPVQSPPCRLCSIQRPCGRASTGTTDHSQFSTQSVRTEAEEADKARSHEEAAPLVPPRCVQFSIERLDLPTPPRPGRPSKRPPRSVMARAPCSERQEPAPTQPTRRDGRRAPGAAPAAQRSRCARTRKGALASSSFGWCPDPAESHWAAVAAATLCARVHAGGVVVTRGWARMIGVGSGGSVQCRV